MKNTTLIFRSLVVIVLLAGTAQLFTYAAKNGQFNLKESTVHYDESSWDKDASDLQHTSEEKDNSGLEIEKGQLNTSIVSSHVVGKWKVWYNDDEYKGFVIYDIKKVGKQFIGYTFQYEDKQGYAEEADGATVLVIQDFDGQNGKGVYRTEYEGEQYDIDCKISMKGNNSFTLSYDYYGYSGVETWKRK